MLGRGAAAPVFPVLLNLINISLFMGKDLLQNVSSLVLF